MVLMSLAGSTRKKSAPFNGGAQSVQDAVNAVMTAMNQATPASVSFTANVGADLQPEPGKSSRHQDVLKF